MNTSKKRRVNVIRVHAGLFALSFFACAEASALDAECPDIKTSKANLEMEHGDLYWSSANASRVIVKDAFYSFMTQRAYLVDRMGSKLLIERAIGTYRDSRAVTIKCRNGAYYFDGALADSPVMNQSEDAPLYYHRLTEYNFDHSFPLEQFTWDLISAEIGKIEKKRSQTDARLQEKRVGNSWLTAPAHVVSKDGNVIAVKHLISRTGHEYSPDSSVCFSNCLIVSEDDDKHLVGFVGTTSISMQLSVREQQISGSYSFDPESDKFTLTGVIERERWELDEFGADDKEHPAGHISAVKEGNQLHGLRCNSDEGKKCEAFFAGPDRLL